MQVITIATEGLGDRSYVVHDGRRAVVIDPQRDVDRILSVLDGIEIHLVCETHVHNDYVTGGLALARMTGADYALNGADDVAFDRRPVADGDVIDVGDLRLTALRAPGHTPTHLCYLLEGTSRAGALFTGGSMLYGTVGRTDLISPDMTERLSRAQHASVRRLARSLPEGTEVLPTHGFGSFCASAGGGDRTSGTIADERRENLACRIDDEDEFVATLVNGFTAHPPYYAHMGLLNRAGPQPPDLSPAAAAEPSELAARIARGEWVVDVRPRQAFARAHLAGSINVDADGALATYLGWSIPWGTPVSLVGDTAEQVADAQRELVRIGIDRPLSCAVGGPDAFAAGQRVTSYRAATFGELADAAETPDGVTVVDVRRDDEWAEGHIREAIHLTLEEVAEDPAALPADGPLWVHCATGFRASIAASLIARSGRDVVWIDDDFARAGAQGVAVVTSGASARRGPA